MHDSPIDSPFPFSDRAIPIIVVAVERDNVDSETELWSSRVPSFRLPYRSVKRVQPRFERELTFQTRWNIHLFDFSYESCQRSLPLYVIPRFYGQSYDHLERGINSIIMWKWKYRMNVKGEEVWILDNLWNERKMIIIIKREKRYDKMLLCYVNLRIECIIIRSKEYFIDTDFGNNK